MPSSGCQTCALDRKSTPLNYSHGSTSYAVFCLKKKTRSRSTRPTPLRRPPPSTLNTGGHVVWPGVETPVPQETWDVGFVSAFFFFFNDTATTEIYPLSLHDALPI